MVLMVKHGQSILEYKNVGRSEYQGWECPHLWQRGALYVLEPIPIGLSRKSECQSITR